MLLVEWVEGYGGARVEEGEGGVEVLLVEWDEGVSRSCEGVRV